MKKLDALHKVRHLRVDLYGIFSPYLGSLAMTGVGYLISRLI